MAVVAGGVAARRDGVGQREKRWFASVNDLPASLHVPVWTVMQLGSLAGALASGATLAAAGRPALGRRVAVAGSATWAGAKLLKRVVRRDRPAFVLDAATVRGREQGGLGYPSGHAAVAAAVATLVVPCLPRRAKVPASLAALCVGPARMYVGAHLPLDVAGGVAFGVACGSLTRLLAPAC